MCTVCEAPSARLPKSHVRTPASMEHGGCAPGACPSIRSIDHWRPPFVGSVSVRETPAAVPGPLFPTVIRNPIASPPSMSGASAVLVTNTSGQSTVIVALAASPPSFVVVTPAVLSTTPQLAAVVDEMMCTDLLSLEPRSPKSQVSTPLVIEQPASLFAASIDQSSPPLVGSVSVTVTPWAVPAPLLVTSIVNPMPSPAVTVPWSAVFVITSAGQFTVMAAVDELSPTFSTDSFEAATTAVFVSVPQSAASVAPVTCTVRVAPSVRSPKSQVRTPAAIEQSAESSLQTIPLGSVSVRVTPCAVPGPSLVTTIVNAAVSPASIVPLSAVLRTVTLGQLTVIFAVGASSCESACDSFEAATTAVFVSVPQSAASVAPVTCTVRVAPSVRSPKLQLRTPAVIEHAAESSLQTTPIGSVSVRVTPLAVPGPSLVTTIVNAAVSPASIVPWSAVLRTVTFGQLTVIVAVEALSWVRACDSFEAATTAVFVRTPQSAASVAPVTCTVRVAPAVRSPKLQLRTPAVIEHAAESSLQTTPIGSASVRLTPLAVPGPSLVTTIVNAAVSPASIVPWSAVLRTVTFGQLTVI